jgi:peptidoglycan/LPS O-acetylase OafA/YrhL
MKVPQYGVILSFLPDTICFRWCQMGRADETAPEALPAKTHADNFDALRCLAALTVLFSHSFPISSILDREPLQLLTGGQASFGGVAVAAFFAISGYLITASYVRSRDPLRYCLSRALRIEPGLIACLMICGLVLGPLVTTLPLEDYFGSAQLYHFLLGNLANVHGTAGLPGVFPENPVANAVNGSLWTIRYEIVMYIFVLVLGASGVLNGYSAILCAALAALASAIWRDSLLAPWGSVFFVGSALYFWQRRREPSTVAAFVAVCLLVVAAEMGVLRFVMGPAMAYIVIYLATSPRVRLPNLARYGDLSYGIYLYAFPVQQLVVLALRDRIEWYWDILLSLPLVLAAAAFSWHLVEKPALELKRGLPLRSALKLSRSHSLQQP